MCKKEHVFNSICQRRLKLWNSMWQIMVLKVDHVLHWTVTNTSVSEGWQNKITHRNVCDFYYHSLDNYLNQTANVIVSSRQNISLLVLCLLASEKRHFKSTWRCFLNQKYGEYVTVQIKETVLSRKNVECLGYPGLRNWVWKSNASVKKKRLLFI